MDHDAERYLVDPPNETAAQCLDQDQCVYGYANAMMRIREASLRTYSKETQDEYDGGETNSEDL